MKQTKKLLMLLTIVLSLAMPANVPLINTISAVETVSAAVGINYRQITLVKGETKKVNVLGTTKTTKWSSSSRSIASVNPKGVITGKKKGTAQITAKTGNSKYTCKVKVVKYRSMTQQTLVLKKGEHLKLGTIEKPKNTKWKSSNPNIVRISNRGLAKAVNVGSCKIYATAKTHHYVFHMTVQPPPAPVVTVSAVTPVPTGTPAPSQTSSVWLSETGSKYHRISNCGRMNPSKARQVSLSEAQRLGYPPCSKCF